MSKAQTKTEQIESTEVKPRSGFVVWAWGWTKSIIIALAVWFVFSSFLIQAFHIPSNSMERTLLVGDVLFVNKALYGAEVPLTKMHLPAIREPKRNDIVVFHSPIEDLTLVKRLVGLPGDTLSMVEGKLFRNSVALDEPYAVNDPSVPEDPVEHMEKMKQWQLPYLVSNVDREGYHPNRHNWGPIVVPNGMLMMLGDNRDHSLDCRFYGFVPRGNLRGTPLFIYFSYDKNSYKPLPIVTAIRWNRLFSHPD
jgi:signal peptidase I